MDKTLLPTGCYDLLPPSARQETQCLHALLTAFEANGYEQVAPPLLEYTESLLSGRGSALASQTFRVMEVDDGKVMGIRPDITLQVARIASSRLAHAPHPLRLSYAGNVLRMTPEGPNASRQLRQAGIELIGAKAAEADAEVIAVTVESLGKLGVSALTIDLHTPGVLSDLLADETLDGEKRAAVMAAVAHKDASAPALQPLTHYAALKTLMECCGPAVPMLARMRAGGMPRAVEKHVHGAERVTALLAEVLPENIRVSVDLTETRGFEYHTGLSFSLFAAHAPQEIGRGGRYLIQGVAATGCTLYLDSLRPLLSVPQPERRVFISGVIGREALEALHAEGFITLKSLPGCGEGAETAKRLGCTHHWRDGKLEAL
ncbi:MAG: ATP phosphoribosyltransferase regulatory subunit [Alphaproteobacteria bacterium]|nr:ATP phosphoribosyltransferase regulatory subunit [Alphaproteobacteria bacterium]